MKPISLWDQRLVACVAVMLNGLDLRWIQACMRIRWILSKKITILILSFIGVGAIAYNYLMQFKNISFDAFEQEEEDEFKD